MAEMGVEMPKAVVKRIVKQALLDIQSGAGDAQKRDFQVNKDALAAFAQASKVFISYVSSAAHDICKENRRSTVTAADIMAALEDLEFEAFIPELRDMLQGLGNKRTAAAHEGAPPGKTLRADAGEGVEAMS